MDYIDQEYSREEYIVYYMTEYCSIPYEDLSEHAQKLLRNEVGKKRTEKFYQRMRGQLLEYPDVMYERGRTYVEGL